MCDTFTNTKQSCQAVAPRARAPLSPRRQGACRPSTLGSPFPQIPTSISQHFPLDVYKVLTPTRPPASSPSLIPSHRPASPTTSQHPAHLHSVATLPYAPFAAWDLAPRPLSHHVSRPSPTRNITPPLLSRAPKPPAHLQHLPRPPLITWVLRTAPLKRLSTPSHVSPPRLPRRPPAPLVTWPNVPPPA